MDEKQISEYWSEYWQKRLKVFETRIVVFVALSVFTALLLANYISFMNMENAMKYYENEYHLLYENYTCIPRNSSGFFAPGAVEQGCYYNGIYVAVCPNATDPMNLSYGGFR